MRIDLLKERKPIPEDADARVAMLGMVMAGNIDTKDIPYYAYCMADRMKVERYKRYNEREGWGL